MTSDLFGWNLCMECGEEWPPACYDADRAMCRACAHENPRKVRKPCTGGCGRRVQTLDRVAAPMCTPCRRRRHTTRTAKRRAYERRRYQTLKRASVQ